MDESVLTAYSWARNEYRKLVGDPPEETIPWDVFCAANSDYIPNTQTEEE